MSENRRLKSIIRIRLGLLYQASFHRQVYPVHYHRYNPMNIIRHSVELLMYAYLHTLRAKRSFNRTWAIVRVWKQRMYTLQDLRHNETLSLFLIRN